MNVLFALYHDLTCNSASHVDGIARELASRGHDCLVAVPESVVGLDRFTPIPYRVATFEQVLVNPRRFANGEGPDLFHAWTPRELIRQFHQRLIRLATFQTVVHLEDNEEHIAHCQLGEVAYRQASRDCFSSDYPLHLSHPRRYQEFLSDAAGATVLIASLGDYVPAPQPRVTFWPAVDASIWNPRSRNDALRHKLGIPSETCVLTYHGNTHQANLAEVRSLYLAVALLNRNGVPAKLIRLGTDYTNPLPEYQQWAAEFTIEMGFVVDRQRVADVLAAADVFVQPGTSDSFNDYRFPSKLPEFFSVGRPVVLPRSNIGLVTRHLQDAYVLEHANGAGICDAVRHLLSDEQLYQRLSAGAQAFAAANFSWQKSADTVEQFYHQVCHARPREQAA